MNRRQKIIVSVTGIFLVLLLLVGLTYAYFLTRITGNTNDKSISVSTANLAIVYGNDDGSVIGEGEKITPGTTFEPKTFTVTNQGNANTDYVVVIEEANVTYAETIEVDGVTQTAGAEATFESNDFTYTLICESGCNSVQEPTTFPIEGGILVGNRLDEGETQTYSFTLTYNETGENQSNDMNKKLEAKINIIDITKDNPYKDNKNSLAYNIINNAILGTTGTTLVGTPETIPAVSNSGSSESTTIEYELAKNFPGWDDITYGSTQEEANNGENEITEETNIEKCNSVIGKYISNNTFNLQFGQVMDCAEDGTPYLKARNYEKVLSVTQDDLGVSYYYRGAVEDNYLEFNNMCWRIVRIEGDGSVKITLSAEKKCSEITNNDKGTAFIGTGHYGYNKTSGITNSSGEQSTRERYIIDYMNSHTGNASSMRMQFDTWFDSKFQTSEAGEKSLNNYGLKLKKDYWCLGNIKEPYDGTTGALLTESINDLMYTRTTFYYDTYRRLYGVGTTANVTLRCDGKNYETHESYIGALTADEVTFAGGTVKGGNINYYLVDNAITDGWWTLSPAYFIGFNANTYYIDRDGYVGELNLTTVKSLRPTVVLESGTLISGGNGTKTNPYIIQ